MLDLQRIQKLKELKFKEAVLLQAQKYRIEKRHFLKLVQKFKHQQRLKQISQNSEHFYSYRLFQKSFSKWITAAFQRIQKKEELRQKVQQRLTETAFLAWQRYSIEKLERKQKIRLLRVKKMFMLHRYIFQGWAQHSLNKGEHRRFKKVCVLFYFQSLQKKTFESLKLQTQKQKLENHMIEYMLRRKAQKVIKAWKRILRNNKEVYYFRREKEQDLKKECLDAFKQEIDFQLTLQTLKTKREDKRAKELCRLFLRSLRELVQKKKELLQNGFDLQSEVSLADNLDDLQCCLLFRKERLLKRWQLTTLKEKRLREAYTQVKDRTDEQHRIFYIQAWKRALYLEKAEQEVVYPYVLKKNRRQVDGIFSLWQAYYKINKARNLKIQLFQLNSQKITRAQTFAALKFYYQRRIDERAVVKQLNYERDLKFAKGSIKLWKQKTLKKLKLKSLQLKLQQEKELKLKQIITLQWFSLAIEEIQTKPLMSQVQEFRAVALKLKAFNSMKTFLKEQIEEKQEQEKEDSLKELEQLADGYYLLTYYRKWKNNFSQSIYNRNNTQFSAIQSQEFNMMFDDMSRDGLLRTQQVEEINQTRMREEKLQKVLDQTISKLEKSQSFKALRENFLDSNREDEKAETLYKKSLKKKTLETFLQHLINKTEKEQVLQKAEKFNSTLQKKKYLKALVLNAQKGKSLQQKEEALKAKYLKSLQVKFLGLFQLNRKRNLFLKGLLLRGTEHYQEKRQEQVFRVLKNNLIEKYIARKIRARRELELQFACFQRWYTGFRMIQEENQEVEEEEKTQLQLQGEVIGLVSPEFNQLVDQTEYLEAEKEESSDEDVLGDRSNFLDFGKNSGLKDQTFSLSQHSANGDIKQVLTTNLEDFERENFGSHLSFD